MRSIDTAKLERLPKWAQDHIHYLTRDLEEEKKRYRELAQPESIEETDTVVAGHSLMGEPDVKLPKGSRITFIVDGSEIDVYVQDGLQVRSSGGKQLSVYPVVSNVVTIRSSHP
jgi:hypothetical protein